MLAGAEWHSPGVALVDLLTHFIWAGLAFIHNLLTLVGSRLPACQWPGESRRRSPSPAQAPAPSPSLRVYVVTVLAESDYRRVRVQARGACCGPIKDLLHIHVQ